MHNCRTSFKDLVLQSHTLIVGKWKQHILYLQLLDTISHIYIITHILCMFCKMHFKSRTNNSMILIVEFMLCIINRLNPQVHFRHEEWRNWFTSWHKSNPIRRWSRSWGQRLHPMCKMSWWSFFTSFLVLQCFILCQKKILNVKP